MTEKTATPPPSRSNWRIVGWGTAGLILLLPLAAMQLTDEVKWDETDFIFAGVLIGGVGLLYELAVRRSRDWRYRAGAAVALAAVFLLIWADGAVGIIGDGDHPASALFALVPVVALVGAVVVRFRAAGMALAMLVTAAVQALTPPIVLGLSWTSRASIWPREIVLASGLFGALWLAAAYCFRMAARNPRGS